MGTNQLYFSYFLREKLTDFSNNSVRDPFSEQNVFKNRGSTVFTREFLKLVYTENFMEVKYYFIIYKISWPLSLRILV